MTGNELPEIGDVADNFTALVDAALDRFQNARLQCRQIEALREPLAHYRVGPIADKIEQAKDEDAQDTDDNESVERIVALCRDNAVIDENHEDRADQHGEIQEETDRARINEAPEHRFASGLQQKSRAILFRYHRVTEANIISYRPSLYKIGAARSIRTFI